MTAEAIKNPANERWVRGSWHSESFRGIFSYVKWTCYNMRPLLSQLLNGPSSSLMHLPSVRLSGEEVEGENALGYRDNLSTYVAPDINKLAVPLCSVFVQAAVPQLPQVCGECPQGKR